MKTSNVKNIDTTNEIAIAKLRANYGNPATGYCEEQADALRAKILNAPNTEELYEIKGTKYYVAADGDDNNDGKTPESPIKSIDRIEKIEFLEGDALLFKRGDTFRFCRSINLKSGITYGSYGEGVKPKIYGSPENYAENDNWKETEANIWQISFPHPCVCGCVIDHSLIIGVLKLSIERLRENGDYYHDVENNVFYLYCNQGKPSEVYADIEIMPTMSLLTAKNCRDMVIDNLCLKYTAGFAISAAFFKKNLMITNCELGFLGGLWVGGKIDSYRYGNAIEFWCGANDVTVTNNWFYQTYDSALTWQGNVATVTYKNISYSSNLFEYNNCDIEFFDKNEVPLENFRMEDNIMRFTSMGWGTRTFDGGIRGIEGCVRAVTCARAGVKGMAIKDTYFSNNTIDCPARQIINWNIDPEQREGIHASGTRIYVKSEYRTLAPCLQGLQTDPKTDAYDGRFACNKQELIEMFPKFETGSQIYWDEEK